MSEAPVRKTSKKDYRPGIKITRSGRKNLLNLTGAKAPHETVQRYTEIT